MSFDSPFTKENLDTALKALGREFRKLNGTKTPAEIILVGGAAILANYGFREMTYDVDAVILASTAMKEAANHVADNLNLPSGWLNRNFKNTNSYSAKLLEVSVYYKTFSNVLTVRMVTAEYLIAMKLVSGRQYKNDLSDIVGVLWEHQKNGCPISKESIYKAVATLYGEKVEIPAASQKTLDDTFAKGDYGKIYNEVRQAENEAKKAIIDFDKTYPGELKGDNINAIIEQARRKKAKENER